MRCRSKWLVRTPSAAEALAFASFVFGMLGSWRLFIVSRAARQGEAELRRYAAEVQDLYNHAPCCYHSLDPDGTYIEVNDTELNFLGYSREELLQRVKFEDLLTVESCAVFREANGRFQRGEPLQNIELEIHRRDGRIVPILLGATMVRDEAGNPRKSRATYIDLSEHTRAEEERARALHAQFARKEAEVNAQRAKFLADATQTLASTLDRAAVLDTIARLAVPQICDWCVIDIVKSDGRIARTLAHRDPRQEKFGRDLTAKYPPRLDAHNGVAEVIRSGRSLFIPVVTDEMLAAMEREPEFVWALRALGLRSYMAVPLFARGKAFGAITFIAAESARQFSAQDLELAEELARRAALAMENARLYQVAREAVDTRDEFLSIASHELKTPITSLKLRLQMARRDLENRPPTAEGLARVFDISHKQVERLISLIDDLLDVSRIQAGRFVLHPEEMELGAVVREVVARFSGDASHAKCEVQTKLEGPVFGLWDRLRIEQVLVNLISNAIKYAPGCTIEVNVRQIGEVAQVSFRDQGPGIPREKLSCMFDRYERANAARHTSGLGLGLYIAKEIICAHHGKIWVESEPGQGATFIIELPALAANQKAVPPSA